MEKTFLAAGNIQGQQRDYFYFQYKQVAQSEKKPQKIIKTSYQENWTSWLITSNDLFFWAYFSGFSLRKSSRPISLIVKNS